MFLLAGIYYPQGYETVRYLAIDYGANRTGLAICDAGENIATPLKTIHGQKQLLERITELIEVENVEAVVLGLPLNMDGSQGAQAKLALKFAELLKGHLDIPVHLQDERLSSFGAEQKLAAANLTKGKVKRRLDAVAAAEILNAFLEHKKSSDPTGIDTT
ncbi:MAG: Holliday junction resolvase RuvX [Planctomycetota bacterium]|jgi:putative Holliday junction resolvase